MNKMINLTLASAIAMTLISGCGGGSSTTKSGVSALVDTAANKVLIAKITDDVIVKGYSDLDAAVKSLADALDVLENDKSQARLEAAQDAWKAARVPWESGEGHIFGPIDTQGVDPASDSWPVIKTDLDGALGGWQMGDSTNAYANEVRGFHAIEYILFGDGATTNTRQIANLTDKQIAYAHELANSMSAQMGTLNYAWTAGGYADLFKGTAKDDEDETKPNEKNFSVSAATEELIGGLIGIADEVGNGKMGDPYNDKDTTLVESQFSWNSTTDFANNITSIKNVWNAGMKDLMTQVDADKAGKVSAQIDDVIKKIKKISDATGDGKINSDVKAKAYRNQIKNTAGRVLIKDAIDALAVLQANLESMQ